MSWYASCCGAAAECECDRKQRRGFAPPPMLCFVGTDDLSSPLCAPSPTGGSTHLPCRAGSMYPAVLLLPFRVCRGGRLCPPARTGAGIRLSNRGADCRVAALLAMTARRCRADGTSGRRPLRVVQRTCPVGRDPCIPPFCSCHSDFVGADDSVRPHALAWESAFPKRGADCRVAALLAMTDFFDSLRGGALPRLCCFAGVSSRKCNSCRNTLHETV